MSQPRRLDAQSEEPFPRPSATGPVITQDPRVATLVLMVGLPAAGKTTLAAELAAAHRALRLTPDHWMIPLFGDSMAGGKRWVLEGRLISVALQALRLGTSVVLDYGLWGRDERSALRWLARRACAGSTISRCSTRWPAARTAAGDVAAAAWSSPASKASAAASPITWNPACTPAFVQAARCAPIADASR
jgi:predicted kinase